MEKADCERAILPVAGQAMLGMLAEWKKSLAVMGALAREGFFKTGSKGEKRKYTKETTHSL